MVFYHWSSQFLAHNTLVYLLCHGIVASNQPEPSLADRSVRDLTTLVVGLSVVVTCYQISRRGFSLVSKQGSFLQTLKQRAENGHRRVEHRYRTQRGPDGTALSSS